MAKLDPNPEEWQFSVVQFVEESMPWLMPYVKGVVFKDTDAARGAGFGYVILVNGNKEAGAIVIVRDYELLPIDVFETDHMMPLTERRVQEALGTSSAVKSMTKERDGIRPTFIGDQIKPPMDAARPQSEITILSSCRELFDDEPRWKKDKMIAGPGWAFAKYANYTKEGVNSDDAKSRVVDEYLDRKEL